MILSKNAFTGYTFEHSWGDGVAGNVLIKAIDLIFTNYIWEMSKKCLFYIFIVKSYEICGRSSQSNKERSF